MKMTQLGLICSFLALAIQANASEQLSRYKQAKAVMKTYAEMKDYTQAEKDYCYQIARDSSSGGMCAYLAQQADVAAFVTQYKKTKKFIQDVIKDDEKMIDFKRTVHAAVVAGSQYIADRCAVEMNEWYGGSGAGAAHAGCMSRNLKSGTAKLVAIDRILGKNDQELAASERGQFEEIELKDLEQYVENSSDGIAGAIEVAVSKIDSEMDHLDNATRREIKKDLIKSQGSFIAFRDKHCLAITSLLYPQVTVRNAKNISKSIAYCSNELNQERLRLLEGQDN